MKKIKNDFKKLEEIILVLEYMQYKFNKGLSSIAKGVNRKKREVFPKGQ